MGGRLGAAAVLVCAVVVAGCSSDGPAASGPEPSGAAVDGPPAPIVTRWWDSPGGAAGSSVLADGTSAETLTPDVEAYCTSLRQTEERSGDTPLDAETDPTALPALVLWAEETAALAPPELGTAWTPVTDFVRAIASSSSTTSPGGALLDSPDPTELAAATTQIRDHAATACGVSLTIL